MFSQAPAIVQSHPCILKVKWLCVLCGLCCTKKLYSIILHHVFFLNPDFWNPLFLWKTSILFWSNSEKNDECFPRIFFFLIFGSISGHSSAIWEWGINSSDALSRHSCAEVWLVAPYLYIYFTGSDQHFHFHLNKVSLWGGVFLSWMLLMFLALCGFFFFMYMYLGF